MFASYRNSGSLNPFPVTNLRPKVELMYLWSQKSPKMVLRARNDRVFIVKRVRKIQK